MSFYSNYTQAFERLGEFLPGEAVDVLRGLFGQCQLPMSTDGPVDFNFRKPDGLDDSVAGAGGCAIYTAPNTLAKFDGTAMFNGRVTGLDEFPVGAVIMWVGSAADVPAKWAIMDGTSNAAGSGIDLREKFVRGKADAEAVGDENGADTHGHTDSTADSNTTGITTGNNTGGLSANENTGDNSGSASGNTDYAESGVTVAHTTTHHHHITLSTALQSGTGGYGTDSGAEQDTSNAHAEPIHGVTEPIPEVGKTGHRHAIGSHTHSIVHDHTVDAHDHPITDAGHTHDVTVATGDNIPAYKAIYFIEKIAA